MRRDHLPGCLFLLVALAASGCGAGALAQHARAAIIMGAAIEAADTLAGTGGEIALAACHTAECTVNVTRVTGLIDVAVASSVLAVQTYQAAVEMGIAAGEDTDVLMALVAMLVRVLGGWAHIVELAREIGVELPALPGVVTLLGGGAT